MNNAPLISVIVPCHNEEGNLSLLARRVKRALRGLPYELLLVDDGSSDGTRGGIRALAKRDAGIRYLFFSRNFGHQAALKAGIDHAAGECLVTMDGDLQHPPEKIPEMVALWRQGYDVVHARRDGGERRGLFKRMTSKMYYKLLNLLSDVPLVEGVADFRLFDRRVAEVIRRLPERTPYLRGLFAWAGFRQTAVSYREGARRTGETKYGVWKMLRLGMRGITSFSVRPLRLSLTVGMVFAFLAFGYGVYALVMMLAGHTVTGWTSVIASVLFLSGIQLIVLGIMGEYLGRLFMENKRRPAYIIAETNIKTTIETTGNKGTMIDDRRTTIGELRITELL